MSDNQAKAMKDVSKNTYAVPARQETYRYFGGLAVVVFIAWKLLPVFIAANPSAQTIGWVIIGALAIAASAKPIIDAISKAISGS